MKDFPPLYSCLPGASVHKAQTLFPSGSMINANVPGCDLKHALPHIPHRVYRTQGARSARCPGLAASRSGERSCASLTITMR